MRRLIEYKDFKEWVIRIYLPAGFRPDDIKRFKDKSRNKHIMEDSK